MSTERKEIKTYILGDTHAEWNHLNHFIKMLSPDIILQCGDFGYWPDYEKFDINLIENGKTKIYFCDGNHENHWALKDIKSRQIKKNIFYMKRGSVLELNGRNILFMGGAESVDKAWRTEGISWFREENISMKDMENLPECRIDMVISHTCPKSIVPYVLDSRPEKENDSNTEYLQYILDKYKPLQWYFGHFHTFKKIKMNGCLFTCLNMAGLKNHNEKLIWRDEE